jgi:hypothetical protein
VGPRIGPLLGVLVATVAVLVVIARTNGTTAESTGTSGPAVAEATTPPESALQPGAMSTPRGTAPAATVTTTLATTTTATAPTTVVTPEVNPDVEMSSAGEVDVRDVVIRLQVESRLASVTDEQLQEFMLATLGDTRGWGRAGARFVLDMGSDLRVVLAEPDEVDALCLPLTTRGTVSCQNGVVVALNSDRWMTGPPSSAGWDRDLETYRQYLVNHKVGHLIGLRHPQSQCPLTGGRAAAMAPQSGGLAGCTGNGFPLDWEIEWAERRPMRVAPLPSWDGPHPVNPGDRDGSTG